MDVFGDNSDNPTAAGVSPVAASNQFQSVDLRGILGEIQGLPAALQKARLTLIAANQQASDVNADVWTPGNLAARWQLMDPSSRKDLIALLVVVVIVVVISQ